MGAAEQLHPQFVIDTDGKKRAVILPFDEYEELLEDLADLAVVAERRDESTISHDELMKGLEADGLV